MSSAGQTGSLRPSWSQHGPEQGRPSHLRPMEGKGEAGGTSAVGTCGQQLLVQQNTQLLGLLGLLKL